MRKCDNCYNGHYNLSERGEEMFCDETEYIEEETKPDDTCEYHRFIPGLEEEKNYVYFDDKYLGPGYLIVKIKNDVVYKFIKLWISNTEGFPNFSLRIYEKDKQDNPDDDFNTVEFDFRDLEDDENGLFDAFTELCQDLSGARIYSLDMVNHARNNFSMTSNLKVTKLIANKDIYYGEQHPTDFIDIAIGDDCTCEKYEAFLKLYKTLSKLDIKATTNVDVKNLLLERNVSGDTYH